VAKTIKINIHILCGCATGIERKQRLKPPFSREPVAVELPDYFIDDQGCVKRIPSFFTWRCKPVIGNRYSPLPKIGENRLRRRSLRKGRLIRSEFESSEQAPCLRQFLSLYIDNSRPSFLGDFQTRLQVRDSPGAK
jgi:hypothetical protein